MSVPEHMNPGRIDVHQHVIPPARRQAMAGRAAAVGWPAPTWDESSAIAMMDRRSIATGVLSYAAPLAAPDDPATAREVARSVNEYTAELVKNRPDRFGHFAALPLPDVDGALAEAAHALDELDADGVMILSNAHGRYPGDPEFEPLWAELAARCALVLVHPTAPPGAPLPDVPPPLADFPYDTTRAALHMTMRGVPRRYPRMRMILPTPAASCRTPPTGSPSPRGCARTRPSTGAPRRPRTSSPTCGASTSTRPSRAGRRPCPRCSRSPRPTTSCTAATSPCFPRTGAPTSTPRWATTRTGSRADCTP